MKKILLASMLLVAVGLHAQIANNDFENWGWDTIYFPGFNQIPPDTFEAFNPTAWTTSNSISGTDSLGGVFFVNRTNDAYSGNYAVELKTDTINLPTIPNFPLLRLTFPGFLVSGKVPVNAGTLLTAGSIISPLSIQGAGQPFTQRLGKIKGYYNYAPVFNPNTNSNDTCIVWAMLKKWNPATEKSEMIGEAVFKSTSATSGYLPFEADFRYASCDTPDSLVVFIASSVPNVQAILGGNSSGLMSGSVLKVDSVYYEDLPLNYNFPPIANDDVDTTYKDIAKTIQVTANDADCNDAVSGLTITVSTAPNNGSAAIVGSAIKYTPAAGFVGIDSFRYTLSDGVATSNAARVKVLVFDNTGIKETGLIQTSLFPVPASNELHVSFENPGKCTARVFDVVGNELIQTTFTGNENTIRLTNLVSGIYTLQILNDKGQMIAVNRFNVSK